MGLDSKPRGRLADRCRHSALALNVDLNLWRPQHADSSPTPPTPACSRSVLVTGATGNLGHALLARLHARAAAVRCLDRRRVGPRPGIESVRGDLTDADSVRAALDDIDTVFLIWPLLDTAPAEPLIAELAAAAPARRLPLLDCDR
ncbi:NAD-dependent epimerase/dehydratase family protein [Streptomyces sparsogenes]|uniref:NAD-dependent epimerase/dehydratase family protein n=1 Tax=Streptomyces sparsogenes TaxID=67365 RepID=UPI0033DD15B8